MESLWLLNLQIVLMYIVVSSNFKTFARFLVISAHFRNNLYEMATYHYHTHECGIFHRTAMMQPQFPWTKVTLARLKMRSFILNIQKCTKTLEFSRSMGASYSSIHCWCSPQRTLVDHWSNCSRLRSSRRVVRCKCDLMTKRTLS